VPIPNEISGPGCPTTGTVSNIADCAGFKYRSKNNDKLSGAEPITATGNFTGHVNSRISVMGQPFNAKCDGTTDDTAAIQSASNYTFKNTGTHYTLYFPRSPNGCRISSWNLTNLNEANIEGEAAYGGFSSFIRCQEPTNNTGTCVDFTGSHNVTIKNLRIHANNGDNGLGAPRIAVFMGTPALVVMT